MNQTTFLKFVNHTLICFSVSLVLRLSSDKSSLFGYGYSLFFLSQFFNMFLDLLLIFVLVAFWVVSKKIWYFTESPIWKNKNSLRFQIISKCYYECASSLKIHNNSSFMFISFYKWIQLPMLPHFKLGFWVTLFNLSF